MRRLGLDMTQLLTPLWLRRTAKTRYFKHKSLDVSLRRSESQAQKSCSEVRVCALAIL